MRARLSRFVMQGLMAAICLAGCLPGDTRPQPAVVHLTVEPGPAIAAGFTTTDGWQISFERLLVGFGGARFRAHGAGDIDADDSQCNSYAGAGYGRLFDFTVGGRQKLADIFGLGACGVSLRLNSPRADSLLGQGVTADDLAFMREQGSNGFDTDSRRSVYAKGKATRGAVTMGFDWSFRGSFSLYGCAGEGDVGFASDVVLASNEALSRPMVIRAEELFRPTAVDDGPLQFDPFAAADADGDHVITLDELSRVHSPFPVPDAGTGSGDDAGTPTLGAAMSLFVLPRIVRIGDSGACVALSRSQKGGD